MEEVQAAVPGVRIRISSVSFQAENITPKPPDCQGRFEAPPNAWCPWALCSTAGRLIKIFY